MYKRWLQLQRLTFNEIAIHTARIKRVNRYNIHGRTILSCLNDPIKRTKFAEMKKTFCAKAKKLVLSANSFKRLCKSIYKKKKNFYKDVSEFAYFYSRIKCMYLYSPTRAVVPLLEIYFCCTRRAHGPHGNARTTFFTAAAWVRRKIFARWE